MGRTSKKLQSYQFKKGHVPYNKGMAFVDNDVPVKDYDSTCERLSQDMFDRVTSNLDGTSPILAGLNSARLLRPKSSVKPEVYNDEQEKLTNRVVNVERNAVMWNAVFREHQRQSPDCGGFLAWDLKREQQMGWAWREMAVCSVCNYQSGYFNLYEEAEKRDRGRKAAKINIGLQIGLTHTPISASSFQKLCLSCNIPCPSTTGMQYMANKVSEKIEMVSQQDLVEQQEQVREINRIRGNNHNTVNIQADCIYNNALYSGVGKTPFRPATQCAYTIAENNTSKHKIIGVVIKNKLCSNVKEHKITSKVGDHPGHCSANISMEQDIGDEQKWAKEGLISLKENELEVKEITTDPDSSAFRAAESLYSEGITSTEPEHFLDTRHVSENHRKFIKNLKALKDIMPARLQREKEKLKDRFANDFSKRCQAEYEQAFQQSVDFQTIKRNLTFASDAIVDCYFGDHDTCSKFSYVCSKSRHKKTWMQKSSFLPDDFKISEKSSANVALLRQCVQYRLGPGMLRKTRKNENTQKVEAVNRAIRTSVAKNVTYRRNYASRVHAAIHNVNHGPGRSITQFCKALGCPVSTGTRVSKSLDTIQGQNEKNKSYKKSKQYKEARCSKRHKLFKLYEKHQEQQQDYQKNKLLPVNKLPCLCLPPDHRSYSRKCKQCNKK